MRLPHLLMLIFVALMLISAVLVLFSERWRTRINKRLTVYRNGIWITPVAILSLYLVLSLIDQSWEPKNLITLVLYFSIPTLILRHAAKTGKGPGMLDIIAMLVLWLPFDLRIMNFRWPVLHDFRYHTTAVIAVIYTLITFSGFRKINLYAKWKLTWQDIAFVLVAFSVLSSIMIPLGLSMNFLKLGLSDLFYKAPWMVPVYLITIFLGTALPEELLFRGVIQNILNRRLIPAATIGLASVIFGLAHINNTVRVGEHVFAVPDWTYVGMATIAGVFYGSVFYFRRSLLAGMALHTLVDFTWVMFLRG